MIKNLLRYRLGYALSGFVVKSRFCLGDKRFSRRL